MQRERDDVAGERARYAAAMPLLEGARLVFVDESGITQGMRLTYGYARRGVRCEENAPYRAGRRVSLIGYMSSHQGCVMPVEGTVDGRTFALFVREVLVPSLGAGDVVVWDTHAIHSAASVAMVEQAGARVLCLPRYSPEYNAIEPMWSKVKQAIRKARADTSEALYRALDSAVAQVTAQDAQGWIRHCGYCLPNHA